MGHDSFKQTIEVIVCSIIEFLEGVKAFGEISS